MNKSYSNNGFSLVELVIAIVILSMGTVIFLKLVQNTTRNSVNPQVRVQGDAIAQAYMEEIMLSSFCDPDWDHDNNAATPLDCPNQCASSACTVCRGTGSGWNIEGTRNAYDDVCDYTAIVAAAATDRNGLSLGTVGDYTVTVTINSVGVALNTTATSNAGQVVRIDVGVTHASGTTMNLSSFKTNY